MLVPETWRSITWQGDVLAAIESGAKPSQTSALKEASKPATAPAMEGKETAVEAESQKEAGRPGR